MKLEEIIPEIRIGRRFRRIGGEFSYQDIHSSEEMSLEEWVNGDYELEVEESPTIAIDKLTL